MMLQKELTDLCQHHGLVIEWADLLRDLDRLQEATIAKDGKRITTRTAHHEIHSAHMWGDGLLAELTCFVDGIGSTSRVTLAGDVLRLTTIAFIFRDPRRGLR
jgi:hypothetical protein